MENEDSQRLSESDDGRTTDDEYQITADQRQAMMELDTQKAEMVYPDEEPPEYDVTDRLKQLNAELKDEDDPAQDRETRVGFKEDPVSMVVPPASFSDDEESAKGSARGAKPDDGETAKDTTDNSDEIPERKDSDSEERHLVERDGKFEHITHEEYMAEESRKEDSSRRPNSASGNDNQREQNGKPRAQSASSSGSSSSYSMTPEHRRIVAERKKAQEKQRKKEEEKRKEEEDEKRKDNEEAFQAWLKNKKEQHKEEARQERERNGEREDDEDRDPEKAYKEWCRLKAKRQQEDKDMEAQRMAEVQDGYFVRSRKECDKAYKEWLKRKTAEKKQQKNLQRSRMYALSANRSRKSQALARAIQYSQGFREERSLTAV